MASSSTTAELFDTLISEIEAEYSRLGHTLGWRFLNVSRRVLEQPVRIALITINPAGTCIPADHPAASCEYGASYLVERWGTDRPGQSTLQVQVQQLFEALARELRYDGSAAQLLEASLVSQFVPFRSPRFAALPRQAESLEFARKLWAHVLPVANPKLVICLGREVQRELKALLPAALGATYVESQALPTGWGSYQAEVTSFNSEDAPVRLLYLPHLSTWTLFTSRKCASFIPAIIHAAAMDA